MARHINLSISLISVFALGAVLIAQPVSAGNLAEMPLAISAPVPPNVIFPLSVEFPTANTAAYQDAASYSNASAHLGIFDPTKCYKYDTTNNWFKPVNANASSNCSGDWSGNFLNWATMTGLDEFRVAMTGGNRSVDTATNTVLERTYQSGQGGTGNFPDKSVSSASAFTPYTSINNIVNQGMGVQMKFRQTSNGAYTTYYVRAKVCDTTVGIESNCTPYGTSTVVYKPTGAIQKYGEKMRFGAFSYFNSNSIDNAVMRSKAKYVAPKQWTSSGTSTNLNSEWSETDGTYLANPDSAEASASYGGAVTKSGVINYINKFGLASSGYKTYDNVGKLYYEALKYLRGLSPTQDFYQYATLANGDGFPIITTWDDPVQYSCQKNFLMVIGDTHTHCDKRLPGGTIDSTGSSQCNAVTGQQSADKGALAGDSDVDVTTWTNKIGSLESITSLATKTFSGSSSYYLSGLAYWAAYNGIRPKSDLSSHSPDATPTNNVKAKTFVVDVQEYKELGLTSQYWYATKYGGVDTFDASGNPQSWNTTRTFAAPYPTYSGVWPSTLLPAGDPAAMKTAIDTALSTILAQSLTATSSTSSSSNAAAETSSAVNAYSTEYDPSKWTGDVKSKIFDISTLTTTTTAWTASGKLPAWNSRKVITFNDGLNVNGTANGAAAARTGTAFAWGNLSPRQQAFLNRDPANGDVADTNGTSRVDYILGDASNEGTSGKKWRTRPSRLGDFINSSLVYVKKPATYVNDTNYSTYRKALADRKPMLYVGGNDGMLHAFNAEADSDGKATTDSGKEVFAYIPSAVYGKLNKLPWVDYSHQYYVDSTPTVADIKLSGCTATTDTYKCWRSVLVGGLGAGGQGIYALNITDPSSFATASASNIVMWEFTDRDDADLGYTFALPYIRKMNNGKWAVIVGGGYNSKTADNDVGGVDKLGSGRAFLYVLFIDGPSGASKTWVNGTDYVKIELKSPDESLTTPEQNGLSTVTGVDANTDGTVDYLYAGDRRGNLWKIDVSNSNPANWVSAYGTAAAPTPLFVATSSSPSTLQQITTSPLLSRHPNGGYLVLFGTGSYVDQSDILSPFAANSFYGIWDRNDSSMGSTVPIALSTLQKQKTLASKTYNSSLYTLQSNCQPQYNSVPQLPAAATATCPASLQPTLVAGNVPQQSGWVLELNHLVKTTPDGERYISQKPPFLASDVLTFKVLTTSGDPCNGVGADNDYSVDYRTGGQTSSPVFVQISGTTATPLYLDFGIGASGTLLAPSAVETGTANGQNPTFIKYTTDSGKANPSATKIDTKTTYSACSNFIPGRPCIKDNGYVDPDNPKVRIHTAPSGTVAWRQLP